MVNPWSRYSRHCGCLLFILESMAFATSGTDVSRGDARCVARDVRVERCGVVQVYDTLQDVLVLLVWKRTTFSGVKSIKTTSLMCVLA